LTTSDLARIEQLKQEIRRRRLQWAANELHSELHLESPIQSVTFTWPTLPNENRPYLQFEAETNASAVRLHLKNNRQILFDATDDQIYSVDLNDRWPWQYENTLPKPFNAVAELSFWADMIRLLEENPFTPGQQTDIHYDLPAPQKRQTRDQKRRKKRELNALKRELQQVRLRWIAEEIRKDCSLGARMRFLAIEWDDVDQRPVIRTVDLVLENEAATCWLFDELGDDRAARQEKWGEMDWDYEHAAPRPLADLTALNCWTELNLFLKDAPQRGKENWCQYTIVPEHRSAGA